MWEYLESFANGGVQVDRHNSFFVGDAAGRLINPVCFLIRTLFKNYLA